jgi:parallel beta-helix repeat protein
MKNSFDISRRRFRTPFTRFLILILISAILGTFSTTSQANPAEIHVYLGDSIQGAINAATTGDTIIVHAGTYTENVDVNKTVNLSTEGAVIVTAAHSDDDVFTVTSDYVNITGFTVTGANWGYGSCGICLLGVSYCNVSNNNLTDNYHGIMLWGLSTTCRYNTLINNTANSNVEDGIVLEYTCEFNTLINNTANDNDDGIQLSWSTTSHNNLTNNLADLNYHGIVVTGGNNTLTDNVANSNQWIGIWLNGNNNTLTNNTANSNSGRCGIFVQSNYNNLTDNTANSNDKMGIDVLGDYCTFTSNRADLNGEYGVGIYDAHHNTFTNNSANNNTLYDGTFLSTSTYNILTNNTFNYNGEVGIDLNYDSTDNTFTENTVKSNIDWDFRSVSSARRNQVFDIHFGSYPTTASFTYDNGIKLKGVETAPPNPPGKTDIGKYLEITNETANSWIFLNISYTNADVQNVDEGSLKLYRWMGEGWVEADGSGVNGVNTNENYVYANLTQFSTFAPFGNPEEAVEYTVNIYTSGLISSSYKTHIYVDDVDQGEPHLWDGASRQFTFTEGETHEISVDEYVSDGTGIRYHCTSYSWTTADSGNQEHTFTYTTQYRLIVTSTYDSPNPSVGSHWYNIDTSITASVTSPADEIDGTRYKCTGWTGTGSVLSSGSGTSVTFTITQPSTVTWNWITQYYLTIETSPHGLSPEPTASPSGPWYDTGITVTCTAKQVEDYTFSHWMLNGASQGTGVNPITVTMNQPHTAVAHYRSSYPVGGTVAPSIFELQMQWIVLTVAIMAIAAAAIVLRKRKY